MVLRPVPHVPVQTKFKYPPNLGYLFYDMYLFFKAQQLKQVTNYQHHCIAEFGTLVNGISEWNVTILHDDVNWHLAKYEALEVNSLLILRLWSLKFQETSDLGVKVGSWELKNAKMGGLVNSKEDVKRGPQAQGCTYIP